MSGNVYLEAEARAREARRQNGLPEEGPLPGVYAPRERNLPAGTREATLQPREALCLSLRYQYRATLLEAGDVMDSSTERARQIETRALRKMSVRAVRELADTAPTDMAAKLLRKAAKIAPIKWRHEPEGNPDWRKP